MQKAKRVGRTVAESSPGERLAKCLEDWLGSKGDACLPDARNIGASDDAWERRRIRVRAQQAIEALAAEELRLACVAAGFRPIVELIERLPFEGPLPSRPIDQAQPARWRFRPRPTDATATELRVDDPAQFLVTLVEGVVPEWIRFATAPATPKPDDGADDGHSTPATRSIVDSGSDLITFNDNERKMLHVMNSKDGQFLWVARVLGDHAGLGDETARRFIKRLCDDDLAERPDGEKSGARLNMAGRRVAKGDFSNPQD